MFFKSLFTSRRPLQSRPGSSVSSQPVGSSPIVGLPHEPLNKEHIFETTELREQMQAAIPMPEDKRQWLGQAMQDVMKHVDRHGRGLRHSEPETLYISCDADTQPDKWNIETLRHLMAQLPTLKHVVFHGPRNPYESLNDLPGILACLHGSYGIKTTVHIHPMDLAASTDQILQGALDELIVDMGAYMPSQYARIHGRPASEFMHAQDTLYAFMTTLLHHPPARHHLHVWANMVLTSATINGLSALLREAERWGVHGVALNNGSLMNGPLKTSQPDDDLLGYNLIQESDTAFRDMMATFDPQAYRVAIRLPGLHGADALGYAHTQGRCIAAFESVALNGGFHTSPCPRWIPALQNGTRVWQGDFWNGKHFQLARLLHGRSLRAHLESEATGNSALPELPTAALPQACQTCPMNCTAGLHGETLNRHLLRF
jgi:hypothetical protein